MALEIVSLTDGHSNNGNSINLGLDVTENKPFAGCEVVLLWWQNNNLIDEQCSTAGFTLWQDAITGQGPVWLSIFLKDVDAGVQVVGANVVSWTRLDVVAVSAAQFVVYDTERDITLDDFVLGTGVTYQSVDPEVSKDLALSADAGDYDELVFSNSFAVFPAFGGGSGPNDLTTTQDPGLTEILAPHTTAFSAIAYNRLHALGYRDAYAGADTTHFTWGLPTDPDRWPRMGMRRILIARPGAGDTTPRTVPDLRLARAEWRAFPEYIRTELP
jgi:hypothetical protein